MGCSVTSGSVVFLVLLEVSSIIAHHQAHPLSIADKFKIFWNVPTQGCLSHFAVDVNVSKYGIITNDKDGWTGKYITIFPHPGLYPRVTKNGTSVFGGIPQKSNLTGHLAALNYIIDRDIPEADFSGLAVIDYEAWRPNWDRNWDRKKIYKTLSINLVKTEHPQWTEKQIDREAKRQFETSARIFMEKTLNLSRQLRPTGQWGYYLYPDCYNHKGQIECTVTNKHLNDRILWLFEDCAALYPSAYLSSSTNSTKNHNLVHGMVKEARRIQQVLLKTGSRKPIYMYSRFRYKNGEYYSVDDLKNTLTQARDLGADGVVLWDDHSLSKSTEICSRVKKYMDTTLGPFVQKLISNDM